MSIIKKGRQHYVVRVDVGKDPFTGARVRIDRTVRGPRAEAEALETELRSQRNRGQLVMPSNATVKDVLDYWLAAKATKGVRPRTLERYTSLINAMVSPPKRSTVRPIGAIRVQDLQPDHVQMYYADSLKEVSASTVRHRHVALKSALQSAVNRKIIANNPAGKGSVEVPSQSKSKARTRALEVPDIRRLQEKIKGTSLEVPVRIALDTGMRLSEILGLRWQDVSLEDGELRVEQTVVELSSKGTGLTFSNEMKSEKGRRTIGLDERTVAYLKQHKSRQNQQRLKIGDVWVNNDLVVCNEIGEPVRPSTVSRHFGRYFGPKAENPILRCRFHDLRHTHATVALANGMHVNDVADRLGHEDPSFTYRQYSHATSDGSKRIASTVNDAMYGTAEAL